LHGGLAILPWPASCRGRGRCCGSHGRDDLASVTVHYITIPFVDCEVATAGYTAQLTVIFHRHDIGVAEVRPAFTAGVG